MARRQQSDRPFAPEEAQGIHEALARINASAVRDVASAIISQRNRGFRQVYPVCWRRIRDLMTGNRSTLPARLYALLAETCGTTGAVVAGYSVLAAMLDCSPRSVSRAAEVLVTAGAVRRFLPGGDGSAYCWALNPDELWGGWAGGKEIAPYHTLTLVPLGDDDDPVATQRAVPTLLPRPKRRKQPTDRRRHNPATNQEMTHDSI